MDSSSRDIIFRNLALLLTGVIDSRLEVDVAISPQLDAVVVFAQSNLVLSCSLSEFVDDAAFLPEPALGTGCSAKIGSGAAISQRT